MAMDRSPESWTHELMMYWPVVKRQESKTFLILVLVAMLIGQAKFSDQFW